MIVDESIPLAIVARVADRIGNASSADSLRRLLNAGRGRPACATAVEILEPLLTIAAPRLPSIADLVVGYWRRFLSAEPNHSEAARQMRSALIHYATSPAWTADGKLSAPPIAIIGGSREALWRILRAGGVPSTRSIRRWLSDDDRLATNVADLANPRVDASTMKETP